MPDVTTTRTPKPPGRVRYDPLVGLKVVDVRAMTLEEIAAHGWVVVEGAVWPTCIQFSDGTIISASQDPCLKDDYRPGAFVGIDGEGFHFQLRSWPTPAMRPCSDKNPFPLPAADIRNRGRRVERKPKESDER